MDKNNLIPEARADKNGNVVTRWVRNLFGSSESARSIPTPTLGVQSAADKEMLEIREKLRATIPSLAGVKGLMGRDIESAIQDKDLPKLQLFEKYGDRYDTFAIGHTLDILRNVEDGEAAHLVTEDHVRACSSLLQQFPYKDAEDLDMWDEVEYAQVAGEERLKRHVLSHLEDAPKVEEIVSRGTRRYSDVMVALKDMKDSEVPTPITDGFL